MRHTRSSRLVAALCVLAAVPAVAAPSTQPQWSKGIDDTLASAAAQNRDTLVWFSGSGWNPASDAVEPALRSASFIDIASGTFALARADFPAGNREQAPGNDLDPSYTVWAERLGVTKLPALVAFDAAGRPYGKVVTPAGDANACVRQLKALIEEKAARDAAFSEAKLAQNKPRAAALARGLSHVEPFARDFYTPVVRELVALDPSDELGLKQKYAPLLSEATIDKVVQNEIYPMLDKGRFSEVISCIDRLIGESHPTTEQRQLLIAFKGQAAYSNGDQAQALKFLDESLAIDPSGPAAERITKAKQQIVETPATK